MKYYSERINDEGDRIEISYGYSPSHRTSSRFRYSIWKKAKINVLRGKSSLELLDLTSTIEKKIDLANTIVLEYEELYGMMMDIDF